MATPRRIQIAIIGGGACSEAVYRRAERVGREVARHGATLVCGGLGGVMEAAARGARQTGGLVVGVLPSYDRRTANRWVDVVIPTGLRHARNVIVAASGDAVIALAGGHGTAAEIALALTLERPVVALGAWSTYAGVVVAASPRAAVATALRLVTA